MIEHVQTTLASSLYLDSLWKAKLHEKSIATHSFSHVFNDLARASIIRDVYRRLSATSSHWHVKVKGQRLGHPILKEQRNQHRQGQTWHGLRMARSSSGQELVYVERTAP